MDKMPLDPVTGQYSNPVDGGHQQPGTSTTGSVPIDSHLPSTSGWHGGNLGNFTYAEIAANGWFNEFPGWLPVNNHSQAMTGEVTMQDVGQHDHGHGTNDGAGECLANPSSYGPFPNNGGGEGQAEKVPEQLADAEHRMFVDGNTEKNSTQSQDLDGETLFGSPPQCTPASKATLCDTSAAYANVCLDDGSPSVPGGKRALEIEVDASESSKRLCSQSQNEALVERPDFDTLSDLLGPENPTIANGSIDVETDLCEQQLEEENSHSGRKRVAKPFNKQKAVSKKAKNNENQRLRMEHVLDLATSNILQREQGEQDPDDDPMFETDDLTKAYAQLLEQAPDPRSASTKAAISQLRYAVNTLRGRTSDRCRPTVHGKWAIQGMTCELDTYQVIASGMMRRIEIRSDKARHKFPRGGILADAMGLGKTVELLACGTNAKTKPNYKRQPTLIVVPASLLKQWENEIEARVDETYRGQKILKYKGSVVKQAGITEDFVQSYDYILTTYGEVRNSYPKLPKDIKSEEDVNEWEQSKAFKDSRGQLHSLNLERIVLDEAHNIKNDQASTSRACIALNAKYYWALTGTPSPNGPFELYAYFKLVRFPGINTFADFHYDLFSHLGTAAGVDIFKGALSQIMIRRRQDQEFLGKKILHLPKLDSQINWVAFNEFERKVYDIIYERFLERMREIVRSKDEKQAYTCIFALFTRLRQLTSHFMLSHDTLVDLLKKEDIAQLRNLADEYSSKHKQRQPNQAGGIGPEYWAAMSRYIDFLETGQPGEKVPVLCKRCGRPPREIFKLGCGHIYCASCVDLLIEQKVNRQESRIACTICGVNYKPLHQQGYVPRDPPQMKTHKKAKGSAFNNLLDQFCDGTHAFVSSAKVREFIRLISGELSVDPQVKILIFSQFTKTLKLLRRVAEYYGWRSASFHGDMTLPQRDAVLTNFRHGTEVNLLFMSLKCGGQGLDIQEATCAITIEPWFNIDVEEQACCRMYRRGQLKETRMYRLAVSSSIDKVIIDMQERKAGENNAVYSGVEKMTAKQLLEMLETRP